MTGERTDILIAGAGFAGLALAIALRQALGPAFAVTVADPLLARPAVDARASAIAAAASRPTGMCVDAGWNWPMKWTSRMAAGYFLALASS